MAQPIVRMTQIVKKFEDVRALDGADLELYPGEVVGLVGANGSGKSTLMGVLCGSILADSGDIWVHGQRVSFVSTANAIRNGIRLLPQSPEIYPNLSVLENIFIGQEIKRNLWMPHLMDWPKMFEAAKELLTRVDAESIDPRARAGGLSGGQKKAVLLARLLVHKSAVLVFDEPAAALGVRQKTRLLELMKAESAVGKSIVFISHDIQDILQVSTRIVVLRAGRTVASVHRDAADTSLLSMHLAAA